MAESTTCSAQYLFSTSLLRESPSLASRNGLMTHFKPIKWKWKLLEGVLRKLLKRKKPTKLACSIVPFVFSLQLEMQTWWLNSGSQFAIMRSITFSRERLRKHRGVWFLGIQLGLNNIPRLPPSSLSHEYKITLNFTKLSLLRFY